MAETSAYKRLVHFLERLHLGYWLIEIFGLRETAVAVWRTVVTGLLSTGVASYAQYYGIRPPEALVLALFSFALILFVWGKVRRADSALPASKPANPSKDLQTRYEEVLGSARHWEGRCDLAERQLEKAAAEKAEASRQASEYRSQYEAELGAKTHREGLLDAAKQRIAELTKSLAQEGNNVSAAENSNRQLRMKAKEDSETIGKLRSDLQAEQAKNAAPDILVTISGGTIERDTATLTRRDTNGTQIEEFLVCITVIATFMNRSSCTASIDSTGLTANTATGRSVDMRLRSNAPDWPFLEKISMPPGLELESNLVLHKGIGATRFIQFVEMFQKSERLDTNGSLDLRAIDSYGNTWRDNIHAAKLTELRKSASATIS